MLSLPNRLKKNNDFEELFKKGRGFKEGFLYLKAAKNNLEESRFGFVVSKKFSKKAYLRNKIKRKLREIVRLNMPEIKKGLDVAIIVLPGLKEEGVEDVLRKLLEKSGITK